MSKHLGELPTNHWEKCPCCEYQVKTPDGSIDLSGFSEPKEYQNLIAAAPELLEAVKVAYSHLHSEVGDKEYTEAVLLRAIARAEGQKGKGE